MRSPLGGIILFILLSKLLSQKLEIKWMILHQGTMPHKSIWYERQIQNKPAKSKTRTYTIFLFYLATFNQFHHCSQVIVVTITVIIRNIIGLHTTIFCFYLATIKALSTFSQCASVGFITALLIRIHRVDVASVALAI